MLGKHLSEEAKEKIRNAALKRWSDPIFRSRIRTTKGRPQSDETKRKLSVALTGHHRSIESRQKQSATITGRKRSFSKEHCENISRSKSGARHPNFGKHRSPETREKIRQAHLRRGRAITSSLPLT